MDTLLTQNLNAQRERNRLHLDPLLYNIPGCEWVQTLAVAIMCQAVRDGVWFREHPDKFCLSYHNGKETRLTLSVFFSSKWASTLTERMGAYDANFWRKEACCD